MSSIQCAHTQVSELYESLSAMPDCTDMTLVFGNKFDEFRSIKNAAICYDLLGQKLKYAAYTAYPPKTRVIEHVCIASKAIKLFKYVIIFLFLYRLKSAN